MTQQLRRTFIKQGLVATGAFSPFGKALWSGRPSFDTTGPNETALALDIQPVLQVAIDAALAAGASYVDCRWTYTKGRVFPSFAVQRNYQAQPQVIDNEDITIGVRSLVKGYWGMSSSPLTNREELVRLARESVSLAKAGNVTGVRDVVLAERAVVKNGSWTMPVQIDPFSVHPSEIFDRLAGLTVFASNFPSTAVSTTFATFQTQTKSFLASDGCSFVQTTYWSNGAFAFQCTDGQRMAIAALESITPAGVGLELFDEARLREEIRRERETLLEDLKLPVKPVDVGRYNTLISASGVAPIVSSTIGAATEIDRVLGHEANATGTSYLKEPQDEMGSFALGNSLLTVTADRTIPGGAATVRWDDEGVAAEAFPLVQQGVVTDFQTDREGAGWMRDVYRRTGSPVRSHGCAFAKDAVEPTGVRTANLRMQPATTAASDANLLSSLSNGVFFSQLRPTLDFQKLSGYGVSSRCYEIKAGKKTAILVNAGTLFRAPDFWKSVQAIGDATTIKTLGVQQNKGQPTQPSFHSVASVPVLVKDLSVIDVMRKA